MTRSNNSLCSRICPRTPLIRPFFVPPLLPVVSPLPLNSKLAVALNWTLILLSTMLYMSSCYHVGEWFLTFPAHNRPPMTPAIILFHLAARTNALAIAPALVILKRYKPRTPKNSLRKLLMLSVALSLLVEVPLMVSSLVLITPHYTTPSVVRQEFFAAVSHHIRDTNHLPLPIINNMRIRGCFGWTSPIDFGTKIELPPPTSAALHVYTHIAEGYNHTFKIQHPEQHQHNQKQQKLVFLQHQTHNTLLPGCASVYKSLVRRLCYQILCGSFALILLTTSSLIITSTIIIRSGHTHNNNNRTAPTAAPQQQTPSPLEQTTSRRKIAFDDDDDDDDDHTPTIPLPLTSDGYVTYLHHQRGNSDMYSHDSNNDVNVH